MELGKAYMSVVPSMRGGAGIISKELTGMTGSVGGKSGRGFAMAFGKSALKAMGAIGIATSIGGIISKGWDRMTSIDTAMAKLKTLNLDAESIKNNALEAVSGTAYGLDTAMTTAASAAAAGIQAGDDMTRYLTNVADAAAMAGIGMDEMGSIFNKIAANGKVSTEEMNQLADRGIPIWQMLADQTGMSMDEVRSAVTNGEVDLETFQQAMESTIGGAAKDIGSNTIKGAISNISASFSRMGANLLGSADDADSFAGRLLPLFNNLMGFMGKIEAGASTLGQVIGSIVGPIMEALGQIFTELGNGSGKLSPIKDMLLQVGQHIGNIVSALVPVLIPAIRLVMTVVGAILTKVSALFNKISVFFPVIQNIMSVVGTVASGIIRTVTNVVKFVTGKLSFAGLVEKVKTIWSKVKEKITEPITKAKEKIAEIIEKIKGKFPFNIGKIIKLKLPKIEIKTGSKEFFGKTITYPKGFKITWNAAGGIVDGATLIGAGEKGAEAIVPLDPFWKRLDKMAENVKNNSGTITINVYSASQDPKAIAEEVERRLINAQNRRRLAWA